MDKAESAQGSELRGGDFIRIDLVREGMVRALLEEFSDPYFDALVLQEWQARAIVGQGLSHALDGSISEHITAKSRDGQEGKGQGREDSKVRTRAETLSILLSHVGNNTSTFFETQPSDAECLQKCIPSELQPNARHHPDVSDQGHLADRARYGARLVALVLRLRHSKCPLTSPDEN